MENQSKEYVTRNYFPFVSTVGKLKEALANLPDDMEFGFLNQPTQVLCLREYSDGHKALVFTELELEEDKSNELNKTEYNSQIIGRKRYEIIYADPPWNYANQGCIGTMANYYNGMTLEEMKALPIKDIAADDCVLFMWATYPFLKEAIQLIEAWGFTYKTIGFVWIKQNRSGNGYFFGLGRWTRGNAEPCLLATKGKPKRINNTISQLIFAHLTRHSEKPFEVRDKIVELVGDKPRIELFARTQSKGWDVFGNEVKNTIQLY